MLPYCIRGLHDSYLSRRVRSAVPGKNGLYGFRAELRELGYPTSGRSVTSGFGLKLSCKARIRFAAEYFCDDTNHGVGLIWPALGSENSTAPVSRQPGADSQKGLTNSFSTY